MSAKLEKLKRTRAYGYLILPAMVLFFYAVFRILTPGNFRFCVPRYPDKLVFFFMIPDTSLHQHNDVGIFDLDNLFCFQPDLFC